MNLQTLLRTFQIAALLLAAAPCTIASTLTYDASLGTLPSAQGWTHFSSALSEANYSVSAGILFQGNTGADINRQFYESSSILFDFTQDTIVETARLQIISSGLSHPPDPSGLGSRRAGWGIQTTDIQGRYVTFFVGSSGFFLLGLNSESSGLVPFDTTTAFHEYEITVNGSGAGLSVDGMTMASLTFAQFGTVTTNSTGMIIGDVTQSQGSSSRLDSFSINVVPEAGSTALAVIGLLGLLTRRVRQLT
jgi:hypothetical protein